MKITLHCNVEHDGKTLEDGETVDLPEKAAKPLLAAGVASLPAKAGKGGKSVEQPLVQTSGQADGDQDAGGGSVAGDESEQG